jgi:dienelactone hydrolase/DNA-directed RNA polymerase subunit RPC12/RpoP
MFKANPELAGKQVRCPSCGGVIAVPKAPPAPASGITVACRCGGRFMAQSSLAGKAVRCPNCSATIQVPPLGASPQPAAPPVPTFGGGQFTGNNDPFADLNFGGSTANTYDPLQSNPTLPAPTFAGGYSPPKRKAKSGSKGLRILWIVLGIIGGGFGVILLGCGGLFFLGLQAARKQATLEQQEVEAAANSMTGPGAASGASGGAGGTLADARRGIVTNIVSSGEPAGPPDDPTGSDFDLIRFPSPVGPLAAYLTRDPGDGRKRPAIVWITGGDNNSIGDVWSPSDRSNDQSACAFRKAGIVMMFPSQRGGNDNPGRREGFCGEADDILAATDFLAQLPYVDPAQIYLGGHSTGGTMVMLVAEISDRYKAVFALGPIAIASQYGGEFVYCDPNDRREIAIRSPLPWLHCVKSPLYVFEGAEEGNWDAIQLMERANKNPQVHFFKIAGHNHFSVIAPLTERLAGQIVQGQLNITEQTVSGM